MSARADSDIDWQLVRRRRRELGISQHQLAQVIGAYAGQISRLEDGLTTGSRAMTVAKLCRLADALSVEPGDLLHRSDSAPRPPGDADNARRLGAVLVTQHRALRPLALAAALRLSLDELHRAAELLGTRLRPFGITVARENLWRLADDPLALTARDRAEIRGAERLRYGLASHEEHVLYAITTGALTCEPKAKGARRTLVTLINQGLVGDHDADGYAIHPDVAYSLDLEARPLRSTSRAANDAYTSPTARRRPARSDQL
jgi:transcriptional regulator with XRE-family HTH domain